MATPDNWFELSLEERLKQMETLLFSARGKYLILQAFDTALRSSDLDPDLLRKAEFLRELGLTKIIAGRKYSIIRSDIGQVLIFYIDKMKQTEAEFREDSNIEDLEDLVEHFYTDALTRS